MPEAIISSAAVRYRLPKRVNRVLVGTSALCRFCCRNRHTEGAGRLMPFFEAVRCHPLDCAGDLRSTLLTLAAVTQRTQGRLVVAGRPAWQVCEGSAQSLPT